MIEDRDSRRVSFLDALEMLVMILVAIAVIVAVFSIVGCGFVVPPGVGPGDSLDAAPVTVDGDGNSDAPFIGIDAPTADAAPVSITLAQTTNETVTPATGTSCNASSSQTKDGTWYRIFRPSDQGVVGPFGVTQVTFAVAVANGASGVLVKIGTYGGSMGSGTLAPGSMSWLQTASVNVPDSASPQRVTVAIVGTIPAGDLAVVAIVAPSLVGVGQFHAGATTSAESNPGYFASGGCAIAPPQTTESLGAAGHVVIDVTGWAL